MKGRLTGTARPILAPYKLLALVFGLIFLLSVAPVKADTIVRGFKANGNLQPGLVVSLSKGSSNTVEAAPAKDPSKIYGVVIDPSQAPLTIQQKDQQVFVSTGGTYPVLVDTQNGIIGTGDYISMSPIDGIGGKALTEQSLVLGKALESFDGKSKVISRDSSGSAIGRINITIIPSKNPLVKTDKVAVPAPLKRFGNAVAGKNVTAPRIYAALAIFITSAFISLSILLVGIRSGMIAIGRNPLSHKSIMRNLLQIVVVSVLVLIIGMFGVYLLLRL